MNAEFDKIESHNRQQLSALMDGDLPLDEARFLLRRMQHDGELNACWERWQLCGDVLRGQALAPAPAGFAERVAQAIAAEAATASADHAGEHIRRGRLIRWGGGALAASVALVALFLAREQTTAVEEPLPASPLVAAQESTVEPASLPPAVAPTPAQPAFAATEAMASVSAASMAVASVPRRQDTARGSATRTQQAARRTARERQSERAIANGTDPVMVAVAPAAATTGTPFSAEHLSAPNARPWPRSVLPGMASAGGALTAGFSSDSPASGFYPFEPRLPSPASETESDNGP